MADLHNLLDNIEDQQDEDAAPAGALDATNDADERDRVNDDRERLDVPTVLAEAERKQYGFLAEKETEELLEEDGLEEDPDYLQLKRLWKLEMDCPDLQPYDQETIGLQMELMEGHEDVLEKLEARVDPGLAPIVSAIYKMDAERVRFLLTDYHRMRLRKMEQHPLHMREMVDRMSENEVTYLKQYGELLERHLRRTVLDHLPKDAWKKLDEPEMIDSPNLDEFVFCKVLESVEIDNSMPGEESDIDKHAEGTCLIVRYSAIQQLVLEGKIEMLL